MPLDSAVAALHPQKQAADPAVSAFVTANAGSGKTRTLVDRVARLLLREADPEAILCVTYTKAAAAEMQRRLFETLGGWAVTSDAVLAGKLAELGEAGREPREARKLFAKALETPGGLKIQTIHAFCEKLLRRFPLEAGVSPGFEVADDPAQAALAGDARAALARLVLDEPEGPVAEAYEHFAIELAHMHLDELLDAARNRRGRISALFPGVAEAEPAVWERCGFEGGRPVAPEVIRAEAVLPPQLDLTLWRAMAACFDQGGKTDQQTAAELRQVIAHAEAGHSDFDSAWSALFTQTERKPRWSARPPKCLQTSALGPAVIAEQDRLCAARERACAATVARDTVYAMILGEAYGAAYDRLKAQRGLLDFSDLVARTCELLTERADAAWVLYKLDGGIEHVLVDEAQDTAPEQWSILRALTEEFFAGSGAPRHRDSRGPDHTVFAVGDEKQSIYSFQGARPERLRRELIEYQALVLGAGRDFKAPTLAKSYRSTPDVLAFVDAAFAPEATRAGVPAPLDQDVVKHEANRTDSGCVDLWPVDVDGKAEERDAWDAPLDAEAVDSARRKLAARIAQSIRTAMANGEAVGAKDGPRPCRYDDFLILVRRRDALFEEIIRALKKSGVPVGGADRLRLSEHILFDDLLALARVSLYPEDDLSLAGLLRSPFFDIDEDALYRLARGRAPRSLWSRLREAGDADPACKTAYDILEDTRRGAPAAQPYEFYARFLQRTDAQGRSMIARLLTRLGREAEDALEAFLGEAIAAEQRGVHGLEAFAAALSRTDLEVKREQEDGRGEVRVMTVHGAKGLEAPLVILPDTTVKPIAQEPALLEDPAVGYLYAPRKKEDCGASAEVRALRDARTNEEGLRLLYVALTRARDRLVICGRQRADRKDVDAGSWYDLCRVAFDRPEVAARVHSRLDVEGREIRRFGEDPALLGALTRAANDDREALPEWARRPAPAEPGSAAYASPSQLAARVRVPASSPLAETRGIDRFRRGDVIHRLLQLLPDLPGETRRAAAAALLAKQTDLTPEQRAEMADAALGVLEDARFAEVFGPGSRAEAAVAGGAPDLPAGLAVSGRVDRMTVTPERVLVVDFKTNRPSPDRVEDVDEAYLQQMAVYVAVLRAIFPGRRVEAALVWTDGPKLTPIPEAVVEATLAKLRAT
jgi:ATP-dependent helicase/nuclease subunit A